MKNKRMAAKARKEDILTAALQVAEASHYTKITRLQIAVQAGVSAPTVQYHFKTMIQLRVQLMRAAVKREALRVVAQGLVGRDPRALAASDDLKAKAWAAVRGGR